jgi:hypothetical protein
MIPKLKSITLPTEWDVLIDPPLATIAILQVALEMIVTAIHCNHADLNEIPDYFANGEHPPDYLALAQIICDRADELRRILHLYCHAIDS